MERCDFSSAINLIRRFISEDYEMNQSDLVEAAFASVFEESSEALAFDMASICRWFTGQMKISPRISGYYLKDGNKAKLAEDLGENILPVMYDSAMAVQETYALLMQDSTISNTAKKKLSRHYPCKRISDEADFLADVLQFCMERTFVKRDGNTKQLMTGGMLSPVLKDFVFDGGVPKPCKHFCGRDEELAKLHELLNSKGKVFLQGIPGIGKSELAKVYAKRYSKDYTNILYLTYTDDLKQDIVDMDFADDLPGESDEERFRKHNRFLRTLKEDTLLIIDNFNTTASEEGLLPVVMKYRCRILFTSRSRFDSCTTMNLEEIQDKKILLELAGAFYSDATGETAILEAIIDTVHSHTLAVELAARLLENGILEPAELLYKLRTEKAGLDTTDTVGITKDGRSRKATYYDHIHTLFSLYQLTAQTQGIMRALTLIPNTGIRSRLFARWMALRDLNDVNDLVEKGFVQSGNGNVVSLHPMIQEVAVAELKPSVRNCWTFLAGIQEVCLRHGEDVPCYKMLSQILQNIIDFLEKDDEETYLRFLEDAFPFAYKYRCGDTLSQLLKEMQRILEDKSHGAAQDRALLLDYWATMEKKPDKAIKLEQEALAQFSEIREENAHLAANIHANLGALYQQTKQLEKAKQHMEAGITILENFGLTYMNDSVAQINNYAVLLCDLGEADRGMAALQKLARAIREYNSDQCSDYAAVQESMGAICLTQGKVSDATEHFKKAIGIYEKLYAAEPERLEEKKQEILLSYAQGGIGLGQKYIQ